MRERKKVSYSTRNVIRIVHDNVIEVAGGSSAYFLVSIDYIRAYPCRRRRRVDKKNIK